MVCQDLLTTVLGCISSSIDQSVYYNSYEVYYNSYAVSYAVYYNSYAATALLNCAVNFCCIREPENSIRRSSTAAVSGMYNNVA